MKLRDLVQVPGTPASSANLAGHGTIAPAYGHPAIGVARSAERRAAGLRFEVIEPVQVLMRHLEGGLTAHATQIHAVANELLRADSTAQMTANGLTCPARRSLVPDL